MSIAAPQDPYARFIDPKLRDRLVQKLAKRYTNVYGSGDVEDAYEYAIEALLAKPAEARDSIENPGNWLYATMRMRLNDRLRSRDTSTLHLEDILAASESDDAEFGTIDDPVVGTLLGLETIKETIADAAELLLAKFDDTDRPIAARSLIEDQDPVAIAAELGLDRDYVSKVTHRAKQERRLLDRHLQTKPDFRCWRLRKDLEAYYQTGNATPSLKAHFASGCTACSSRRKVTTEATYAALAPFLPLAAAPAGLLGVLRHGARSLAHPARSLRRVVRPLTQLGGKTTAGSTQMSTVAGAVSSHAVAIAATAAVAAVGTTAAVVVAPHLEHHKKVVVTTPTTPRPPVTSVIHTTPTVTTPTHTTTTVHHKPKPKRKPKPKHHHKKRRAHVAAHTTTTTTTSTYVPPATSTPGAVTTPTTTTTPLTTSTPPPPVTTTTSPTRTTTPTHASTTTASKNLSNPSYQTPQAP